MVTTVADGLFALAELEKVLLEGGEFPCAAGPMAKGSNLCHGTGGNGYGFLKLYRRTNDPIWVDGARQVSVTAILHCRSVQMVPGRGRYSLWSSDIGLAMYLCDSITGHSPVATLAVFALSRS